MYTVGVVEILAGFVVLIVPRFGGLLVAGWLGGIILSLLLVGGYGDIALRDVGLLLGALTLFRLAGTQSPIPTTADSPSGLGAGPIGPPTAACRLGGATPLTPVQAHRLHRGAGRKWVSRPWTFPSLAAMLERHVPQDPRRG